MLNPEINYTEAGRKSAEARNQRDEARAMHWAQYYQGMRGLEQGDNRQKAAKLYQDAYEAERRPACTYF